MSWLDLSILGIIGVSVIYSFIRGVVREIFSFLALIAGYLVATRIYGYGTPYLGKFVADPRLAGVISFVAVFLTISVLVGAVGRLLHVATKKARLSFANRLLGAFFGFFKGLVVVSIVLLMIPVFSTPAAQGKLLQGSRVAPLIDVATEALSSVFPTRKYGTLDNRLSKELKVVRDNRRQGFWSNLSKLIQQRRKAGPDDPGQTTEEERKIQDILKK